MQSVIENQGVQTLWDLAERCPDPLIAAQARQKLDAIVKLNVI
jgi:hypothetical protein